MTSQKAHQKAGSFAPPALPGINARMTLSDSRQVLAMNPAHDQPAERHEDGREMLLDGGCGPMRRQLLDVGGDIDRTQLSQ